MTYAGLKSFIYAGLKRDDPRVRAAWQWIQSNWTLSENPGMRQANPEQATNGLYYYLHTTARALHEFGQPWVTDSTGQSHDWRVEFIETATALQQPDGGWSGDARWMENNPVLVTSYMVLALQEVKKDIQLRPVAEIR
jgi:squalene-hopene/tetraprenyl-beta-curcumene cyclase